MARPPRNTLDTMPQAFLNIAALATRGGAIPPLECGPRNLAINLRHRFYKFRIAMIEQQHPDAAGLPDVTVTLQEIAGTWFLQFHRLGLGDGPPSVAAAHAHEHASVVHELLTHSLDDMPDAPAEPDHTEDAVAAFLRGKPGAADKPEPPLGNDQGPDTPDTPKS